MRRRMTGGLKRRRHGINSQDQRHCSQRTIRHQCSFCRPERLLEYLRFSRRIKGGHYIYSRAGIEEILNLQPLKGGGAKPYQVKQVRLVMLKYRLEISEPS